MSRMLPEAWARMSGAWQRRAARWCGRRPVTLPRGRAIISFSFDDFPRSALHEGGRLLERFGAAGTYYTSLGLAGTHTACGEMFSVDDIPRLLARGHELGCHTFDHCPAWSTPSDVFEASVLRNEQALRQQVGGASFPTLSYPISYPRPETKRRAARQFACCRGGGQRLNTGTIDLNYLSSFFLEQSRDDPGAVERAIIDNQVAGGWLIFSTHDISNYPSPFGCTPQFFEQIVGFAAASGAEILPVGRAWATLHARSPQGT